MIIILLCTILGMLEIGPSTNIKSDLDQLCEAAYSAVVVEEYQLADSLINEIKGLSNSPKVDHRLRIIQARLLASKGNLPKTFQLLIGAFDSNRTIGDKLFAPALYGTTGYAYYQLGNQQKAREYYDLAIEMSIENRNWIKASEFSAAYGMMALFSRNYDISSTYHHQALGLLLQSDTSKYSTQVYLPKVFMNLAIAQNRLSNYEEALSYAQLSVRYGLKSRDFNLPSFYMTLGTVYKTKGDTSNAISAYHSGLNIAHDMNQDRGKRMALSNLARLFGDMALQDSALFYLKQGEVLENASNNHSQGMGLLISDIFQKRMRLDSALYYAQKTLILAERRNNAQLKKNSLEKLSELHNQMGNLSESNRTKLLFQNLEDSINNAETQKAFDYLKVQLESVTKESQLAQLNQEIKIQKKITVYLVLLSVLSVGILFFIIKFWLSERKRKSMELNNVIISKETIEEKLKISQQELADYTIKVLTQNRFLEEIEASVKNSSTSQSTNRASLESINKTINLNKSTLSQWDSFIQNFGNAHNDFFEKLKSKYPGLTQGELKHCALVKMNMSIKESANLLGVDQKSVKMARYRLKKKMNPVERASLHTLIYSV